MASNLSLRNSTIIATSAEVNEICKPLKSFGINYFRYMTRYNDYSRAILCNRPEIIQYCYEEHRYPMTWYDNNSKSNVDYSSGFDIWAIHRIINESQEIDFKKDKIMAGFKIFHGVSLLIKYNQFMEIFEFASPTPDIYSLNHNIFKQFVFYFRENARELILQAEAEKLLLTPETSNANFINEKLINYEYSLKNNLCIKKYFLPGIGDDFYLTAREAECLQAYIKTGSAKAASSQLNISFKTILRHIENVKQKSGRYKLMEIAKELGIFSDL